MTVTPWFSVRGGQTVHIARHEPSGYGIRALCGYSLDEGRYVLRPERLRKAWCRRCRAAEARQKR